MRKKKLQQDQRQLQEANIPHAPDSSSVSPTGISAIHQNYDLIYKIPPDPSTVSSSTQMVNPSHPSSEVPGQQLQSSPKIALEPKLIQQMVSPNNVDKELFLEQKQLFFKPKLNLTSKRVLNSIPSQPELKNISGYSSSLSASQIHSNVGKSNFKEPKYDRRSSLRQITQSPDKNRNKNNNLEMKNTVKSSVTRNNNNNNNNNIQIQKQFQGDKTVQIRLFAPNDQQEEPKGNINQNKLFQFQYKPESQGGGGGEDTQHKEEREQSSPSGQKECLFQNQLIQQVMNNSISPSTNEILPSFDINQRRESQQISSQLAYYQGSNRPMSNQTKRNKFILLCPQSGDSNCNNNLINNTSNSTKEDLLGIPSGKCINNTSQNLKVPSNSFYLNKQTTSKQFEDTIFTHGMAQIPQILQQNLPKQQPSSSKLLCSLLDNTSSGSFWAASGRSQIQPKPNDETWNKAKSQGYSRIKNIVQSQISNAESKFSNHLSALSVMVDNIHKRNNASSSSSSSNTNIPASGIQQIHETYLNPSRSEKLLPQNILTPLEVPPPAPLKNLTQGICGKQIDIKSTASIALQRRSAGNFFKPSYLFQGLNQTNNEWNQQKNNNNKYISAPSSVLSWEASSSLKTISHVYFPNRNNNNNNNSLDQQSPYEQLKQNTETKLNSEQIFSQNNPRLKSPQKIMRNSFFKENPDKSDAKINSKQLSESFIQLSQPHPSRKIIFSYSGHDKV